MGNEKKTKEELNKVLIAIDGQTSRAYRDIIDSYDYKDFVLYIDYVPWDAESHPSRLRANISLDNAKFPNNIFSTKSREVAARDFIVRQFVSEAARYSISSPGVKGGHISIDRPSHELLETNAAVVGNNSLEIRFAVNLPVKNGKVFS